MCSFYATFVIKQNYKNNGYDKYFNIEKIRQFTQSYLSYLFIILFPQKKVLMTELSSLCELSL